MHGASDDIWNLRTFFYTAMHVLFAGEPSRQLFAVLTSDDCLSPLHTLSEEAQGVDGLCAYLERCKVDGFEEELESAKADYNRVILGLGKRKSHPWESAYTSVSGLLFREETLSVREAYLEQGLEAQMFMNVADDHIALECEFMALLAKETALQGADGQKAAKIIESQVTFIEKHLSKWLELYADELADDAPESIYAHASKALASFVKWDYRQCLKNAQRLQAT